MPAPKLPIGRSWKLRLPAKVAAALTASLSESATDPSSIPRVTPAPMLRLESGKERPEALKRLSVPALTDSPPTKDKMGPERFSVLVPTLVRLPLPRMLPLRVIALSPPMLLLDPSVTGPANEAGVALLL